MLTELNLFKFDILVDECRSDFQRQIHACGNGTVQHVVCDWCFYFFVFTFLLFSVLLLFYGLTPEIKMDWLIDNQKGFENYAV